MLLSSRDYWAPVCALVSKLRCWTRVGVSDGATSWTGDWGMLLTQPSAGYLESAAGPLSVRHIEWVQLSLEKPAGGRAGVPLQFRDVSDELTSSVRALPVSWELRDSSWSVAGIFAERPVRVVHLPNPFWKPNEAPRQDP